MTVIQLQTLCEFDSGEFHALQCLRFDGGLRDRHAQGAQAQDWLLEHDLIEVIGDEFHLTVWGKDVLDVASRATARYVASLEGK